MQDLELEKHMQPLIFGRAHQSYYKEARGWGQANSQLVEKVVCLKENQTLTQISWSWCRLTI